MTDAHDGDEIREGRTRAQSRARNQQEAVGLLCDLGPVAGHQILRALIAEKGTRSMLEPCDLPTELIQDVEPEPNTYAEANASQYAELWRRAMSVSSKDYWQLVLLLCRVWCLKAIRFLPLDGYSSGDQMKMAM